MEELTDKFQRKIDYLRISVTDRCNLRCIYCMPNSGILQKPPSEILTFEEISKIVKLSISVGINKIKITGGEPLVRKGLAQLLELLVSEPGLKDLALTTNGLFLKKCAKEFKAVGLKRMNISLDTLNAEKFERITRLGRLQDVLGGIDAALVEGLFIKINVVMMKGINDDEILDFAEFARERKVILRFIELMPTLNNEIADQHLYISCEEVKERLKVLGSLKPLIFENARSGPAQYYEIGDSSLTVGFISPISCKFCFRCNRLRLTADGLLMPCLTAREVFDLKSPLREDNEEEVLRLIKKAVLLKPAGHNINFSSQSQGIMMSQIGG